MPHTFHAGITITRSEHQFLDLVCSELSYAEIAAEMHISKRTVDSVVERLFIKLGVKSREGIMLWALKTKFVKLNEIKLNHK